MKRIPFFLLLACLFAYGAFSHSVFDYLLVSYDGKALSFLTVQENTLYWPTIIKDEGDYDASVEFYDLEGNMIGKFPFSTRYQNSFFFDGAINRAVLVGDGGVMAESLISFCDSDGVCEPCEGPGCIHAENFVTCSDCSSGAADGYCDLLFDGICDPDCSDMDGDCEGCAGNRCIYDGNDPKGREEQTKLAYQTDPGSEDEGGIMGSASGSLPLFLVASIIALLTAVGFLMYKRIIYLR